MLSPQIKLRLALAVAIAAAACALLPHADAAGPGPAGSTRAQPPATFHRLPLSPQSPARRS